MGLSQIPRSVMRGLRDEQVTRAEAAEAAAREAEDNRLDGGDPGDILGVVLDLTFTGFSAIQAMTPTGTMDDQDFQIMSDTQDAYRRILDALALTWEAEHGS